MVRRELAVEARKGEGWAGPAGSGQSECWPGLQPSRLGGNGP